MPRLSRKDEARQGRRPSEGQYLSMPQLQGGHDSRGLGSERFLLPVAHVQAEIKKSFVESARLALPRAAPIQQLRPFPQPSERAASPPQTPRARHQPLALGDVRWEFYRI